MIPEPAFAVQCCDATHYLTLGWYCATQGGMECVNGLRPAGALLWFSLPYRFGWPPAYLIHIHLALLLLSVLLSTLAAVVLVRRLPGSVSRIPAAVLALPVAAASYVAHGLWFMPVFHVALTDAPAGLCALLAVWCLILSLQGWRWAWVVLSALLLGLALSTRAFYLYPVMLGLAAWMLCWLWQRCRPWAHGLLVLALVPAALQVAVVHERWGEWAFLPMTDTGTYRAFHLSSPTIGYDTLHPWQPRFWYSACPRQVGVQEILAGRDWRNGACLLLSRLYFYGGSYGEQTYVVGEFQDMFVVGEIFADDIGNPNIWAVEGMVRETDVQRAPDGQQTVDRFVVQAPAADGAGRVYFYGGQSHLSPHRLTVWLWADKPKTLDLVMYRVSDGAIVARKTITLGLEPQEYTLEGTPLDTSSHGVMIGKAPGSVITFGTEAGDTLYSWTGKLVELPEIARFHTSTPANAIRQWLPGLAWFNALTLLLAAGFFWQARRALGVVGGFIAVLAAGMAGQALLIIPEQRFAIVPLVLGWHFAALALVCAGWHLWQRWRGPSHGMSPGGDGG